MVAALAFVAALAAIFVSGSSANLAGSTFEGNDGNLIVNGGAGAHDWDNAPNLSVGQDLASGTQDNSFGQGTKEDLTNVTVVTGSIPNSKADLARFAVAGETVGSDSYLYLAWSRENQSGTVNFDFEINASAQPDLTTAGPKVLNRTVNDLLINYAFQGGSNTPALTLRKWTGSAWGAPSSLSGCSEGLTNAAPVSENLGGLTAVNRPAQQFGEAAINLTCANVIPPNSCESFADAYVKSRSSTSFTSEIKDFIAPVSLSLSNCGSIKVIKHTNPRGLDQAFGYTTTGGLSPATFSLNDTGNSAGGDSAGNTRLYSSVHPGTYTVSEDADPTGFAFASLVCTGGGANTSTSGRIATINLDSGENVVCTYVNDQQLGAIRVSKTSIKGQALAGAHFSVTGPGGFSHELISGADGTDCVAGLVFGSYSITETAAPAGYDIDDTSAHAVQVDNNTDCSGTPEEFAATDTPLTDIHVTADSQAVGGTNSQITCVDASAANIGDSPSGNVEHAAVEALDLHPGTYTCTVVVDP
jgi:hypothetical protein